MSKINDEIKKIDIDKLRQKLDIINKRELAKKTNRGGNAKFSLQPLTFPEAMYILALTTPKRLYLKNTKGKPKK